MNQLKKKGHDVEIKAIIVHQVNKEAHSRHVSVKRADKVILPTDKEKRFIADLHKSYYERSSPIHGVFDNDNTNIRGLLDEHLQGGSFLDFSLKAVNRYKEKIEASDPATGGYLVICEYTKTGSNTDFLLVLTTQNKEGFTINDNLTIESVESIDMSKVDVACLINLTRYAQVKDLAENNSAYLSFVRGNKDLSFYFMSFMGCKDKTTPVEASRLLMKSIDAYCDAKHYDSEQRRLKKDQIYAHCLAQINNREAISLHSISALINPMEPEDFKVFASEQYNISSTISGSKSELRKLTSIYYKGKTLMVSFDRKLVNDKVVVYDADKKELLIKNVPDELANQIMN